ncbi:hypothetical protein ACFX13_024663 [Malus domestica]
MLPFPQSPSKPQSPSRLINFFIVSSSLCTLFLLGSLFLVFTSSKLGRISSLSQDAYSPPSTSLEHVVFGIASNQKAWSAKRKEYVRLWWRNQSMRGCVFLDSLPPDHQRHVHDTSLPPACISGDTARFRYTSCNVFSFTNVKFFYLHIITKTTTKYGKENKSTIFIA